MMAMPVWLSWTEKLFFSPKMSGTKMITDVRVAAITAVMTSCVPILAALTRSIPISSFW